MKLDWKSLVKIVATTVLPLAYPKLGPAVPYIIEGIERAEELPKGTTKTDKLNTAIDIAVSGAKATNVITGKNTIDIDAMNKTVAAGISAVVNGANVFHRDNPSE
jgi:hypothetical protein